MNVPREVLANDIYVRSNREMLSKTLSNLVCNSIQHGGGGTIRVSLRVEKLDCLITVSDGGAPVVQELRESAFTAKGQVAAKGSGGGRYSRGLGLFVATIAAEAAGARISATEEDGHNVFELVVPLD